MDHVWRVRWMGVAPYGRARAKRGVDATQRARSLQPAARPRMASSPCGSGCKPQPRPWTHAPAPASVRLSAQEGGRRRLSPASGDDQGWRAHPPTARPQRPRPRCPRTRRHAADPPECPHARGTARASQRGAIPGAAAFLLRTGCGAGQDRRRYRGRSAPEPQFVSSGTVHDRSRGQTGRLSAEAFRIYPTPVSMPLQGSQRALCHSCSGKGVGHWRQPAATRQLPARRRPRPVRARRTDGARQSLRPPASDEPPASVLSAALLVANTTVGAGAGERCRDACAGATARGRGAGAPQPAQASHPRNTKPHPPPPCACPGLPGPRRSLHPTSPSPRRSLAARHPRAARGDAGRGVPRERWRAAGRRRLQRGNWPAADRGVRQLTRGGARGR